MVLMNSIQRASKWPNPKLIIMTQRYKQEAWNNFSDRRYQKGSISRELPAC